MTGLRDYVPAMFVLGLGMMLHYLSIVGLGRALDATFFVYILAILIGAWTGYAQGLLVTFLVFAILPFFFRPDFSISQINVVGVACLTVVSLVVSRTAAARKHAEAELRGLNAQLEQRIAEKAKELLRLVDREQSARREAETAAQQLQAALQAGGMGTWQFTMATGQVRWSPGLEAIHGYSPGTFAGTVEAFRDEIHPDDQERVMSAIAEAAEHGRDHHIEYRIVRSDGTVRWVEGIGQVLCDEHGRPDRMVGVCADITGRKQVERERADLLVREQTARAELERAGRMKDEFLAVLSHELRTPLNAVLGYAQILSTGILSPEQTRHALGVIQRNALAQARLIESLLDLSRIMADKFELDRRPVEISSVVDAAVEVLRPEADRKDVAIDVSVPATTLVGDAARLQQVMWNLLSNAVKFTPSGGRVQVSANRVDGDLRIQVRDTGRGIAPDVLPRIFDRYWQADSEDGAALRGLGVGLTLVKEIVQAHRGAVTGESGGVGLGSTFTVTLPLATDELADEARTACASEADVPESPAVDVLVVDDDADGRELLALMVGSRSALVRKASSATEALAAIRARRPDLLLADLRMPDEDGLWLIQKIRAQEVERDQPRMFALAVTAHASPSDRERALAAGYDGHVAKPIDDAELSRAIATLTRPAAES